MKKIIVITTAGDNREDGNVYYSRYIIVESPNLQFDEPIFTDDEYGPRAEPSDGLEDDRFEKVIEEIRRIGYNVEDPDVEYIEVNQ